MYSTINTICVCGAGTMGSGIAQVMAQNGFRTLLFDLNSEVLEKARTAIDKNLTRQVEKGRLTGVEKDSINGALVLTDNMNDCKADLIIEAIIEKPEAKAALFNQLAQRNDSRSIFATNTSSLSVTDLAARIAHPARVLGMHFFNPAPVMKLVEVVSTPVTALEVTETVCALIRRTGKIPVVCKDAPGFIVNRVARPYYLEALKLAEQGMGDFETIDSILEATGFKMGPFRLMDLIGNDINLAVTRSLYEACGRPARFEPSVIQERMVKTGDLGKKTGEGYYKY